MGPRLTKDQETLQPLQASQHHSCQSAQRPIQGARHHDLLCAPRGDQDEPSIGRWQWDVVQCADQVWHDDHADHECARRGIDLFILRDESSGGEKRGPLLFSHRQTRPQSRQMVDRPGSRHEIVGVGKHPVEIQWLRTRLVVPSHSQCQAHMA